MRTAHGVNLHEDAALGRAPAARPDEPEKLFLGR